MKNQPGTMTNQPGTMKNHGNQPKTMINDGNRFAVVQSFFVVFAIFSETISLQIMSSIICSLLRATNSDHLKRHSADAEPLSNGQKGRWEPFCSFCQKKKNSIWSRRLI